MSRIRLRAMVRVVEVIGVCMMTILVSQSSGVTPLSIDILKTITMVGPVDAYIVAPHPWRTVESSG